MHGAEAGLLQALLDAEIEIGRIDADHHDGLFGDKSCDQFLAQLEQARQVTDDFGEAEQRKFAYVVPGVEACCLHAGAADAGEARVADNACAARTIRSAPS